MLSKKGKVFIVFALAIAVLLTGRARLALDELTDSFRSDFREMLYLPRGKGLKVLACGFDAPLADALFIKSLIYFGEAMQAKGVSDASRGYTYELYDVITDLSPRFYRAYQVGALFLTSSRSLKSNKDGIRLLDKGIKNFDAFVASGEKFQVDPRWMLHLFNANTYEVNIQSRLREAGDNEGASEARRMAADEFRLAAASPGAPPFVILAASGFESVRSGKGNVEDANKAMLTVWKELHAEAAARGDKEVQTVLDQYIRESETLLANIATTREVQKALGDAGKIYVDRHGTPPVGVADLIRDGLIPGQPMAPLSTPEEPDTWLAMPDGSFRSGVLSSLETNSHIELLNDAIIAYRRAKSAPPADLDTLVAESFIEAVPTPPLAGIGQVYKYDQENGNISSEMPLGPELPPERK